MLPVSYAGKNAHSAGKSSGVLRGGALGANRGYVLVMAFMGPNCLNYENPYHHNQSSFYVFLTK